MHGPGACPTPLSPWERRGEWQAAALAVALVVAPEALQVVRAELAHEQRHAPVRELAAPRSRRLGRRPGVRPPRSC